MNDNAKILAAVGEPAVLEGLAEECAELAKAALKLARIKRGENPTPVPLETAKLNFIEEVGDVHCYLETLARLYPIRYADLLHMVELKRARFVRRLEGEE